MLDKSPVCAVLAVKSLPKAKEFYEGKLGLKSVPNMDEGGVMYACGMDSRIFVYESSFAGTNKATAAAWKVDDLKASVEELKAKGIKFEHYDMPGVKHEGDVHVYGKLKSAWFTDPDGNILNLIQ